MGFLPFPDIYVGRAIFLGKEDVEEFATTMRLAVTLTSPFITASARPAHAPPTPAPRAGPMTDLHADGEEDELKLNYEENDNSMHERGRQRSSGSSRGTRFGQHRPRLTPLHIPPRHTRRHRTTERTARNPTPHHRDHRVARAVFPSQ